MNYAKIRDYDIANGEGVRTSLFVSGCENYCPGCFNPEEQDFNFGKKYTQRQAHEIVQRIENPVISGLSILGGDPLCQDKEGLYDLISLCDAVCSMGKTVWLWTGFLWESVMTTGSSPQKELLVRCNVVVDGPFVQALSGRALKWRGSANQRVIDVQRTLQQGEVVLYEE
jgi:anaerobic ribonucleoside-triphosphate reductase activating protein